MRTDKPKCEVCEKPITDHWSGKCLEHRAVKCRKCGYAIPNKTLRAPKESPCPNCKKIENKREMEIQREYKARLDAVGGKL